MTEDVRAFRAEPERGFTDRLERDLLRRLAGPRPHQTTVFDPVVGPVSQLDPDGSGADGGATAAGPSGRRRWPLVAVAVGAVVALIVATVLLRDSGTDRVQTRPADSVTAPTTPSRMVSPPSTSPDDGSTTGRLLPEGLASAPPTGELLASVTLFHRGMYRLYADGRLISHSDRLAAFDGYYSEQRLTPDGIEHVHSALLSSGLFETARARSDDSGCATSDSAVCVRDGGRILAIGPYGNPERYEAPAPEAVRLFDDLERLVANLPPTYRVDPDPKPYVAARIAACMRMFGAPVADRAEEMPLDLSVLMPRFPAPAADLLAGREPSEALTRRLTPVLAQGDTSLVGQGGCFELTLDEARTLADVFLDPTGGGTHEYWGITIRPSPGPDSSPPGAAQPGVARILFRELLPDGTPKDYFGG